MKEMFHSGDNRNRKRLRARPVHHGGQLHSVILFAMQNQGLEVSGWRYRRGESAADTGAHQHQFFNRTACVQTLERMGCDKSTEGKSGQRQRSLPLTVGRDVLHHRQKIFQLAPAFVVATATGANAPKIEANRRPAGRDEGPRQRLNHLVVQRAAEKRMRVGNDGNAARLGIGRIQRDFQYPRGALNGGFKGFGVQKRAFYSIHTLQKQ